MYSACAESCCSIWSETPFVAAAAGADSGGAARVAERTMMTDTVASGSWSSKVELSMRSWRNSEGGDVGVERWMAWRDIDGYGIEIPIDVEV